MPPPSGMNEPCMALTEPFEAPVVIAPAMHTGMWEHPATRGNVETLRGRGVTFVGPVEGALAKGDSGVGGRAVGRLAQHGGGQRCVGQRAEDLVAQDGKYLAQDLELHALCRQGAEGVG